MINSIQAILRATMGGMCLASAEGIVTLQSLCQEVGCPYHDELRSTICCVALVVLWMGLHQEKFPLLATSLQAAAGVVGRQRWALIFPSSARVSLVTYTVVIAVRYRELDNVQNDLVCFGNYLLGEQATSGGFFLIFWDAPSAYIPLSAIAEASSRFPHCCPSSLRATSVSSIQDATGLYSCWHS